MKPFEFLAVYVSIILALGTAHILSSAMRLIRCRGHVRVHGPTLLWMASLFLSQLFVWWIAFQRLASTNWTFFRFLLYLLIPILVSVPGYLLVPEGELERELDYDLEADFSRNRKWFFAILATLGIAGYVESAVRAGRLSLHISNALPLLIFFLSLAGIILPAKRAQLLLAWVFLAIFLCYIGFVFARL
jgi:hypothetical protein